MKKLEKAIKKATEIIKENKDKKNLYEMVRLLCIDEDIIEYYDLISELIMEVRSHQRWEEYNEEVKHKND